jgi:hypothetical protein
MRAHCARGTRLGGGGLGGLGLLGGLLLGGLLLVVVLEALAQLLELSAVVELALLAERL